MKILRYIFVLLIVFLLYPLLFGKGSWLRVWNINQQVKQQEVQNALDKQRNDTLKAEVRDLKKGSDAVEERARSELGMIKPNEEFYQVIDSSVFNQPTKPQPD
ncbi:MAG: cell division protein FtsB [Methylophilaceae bacterium]|jgi:cell division protein FtsB|nr:cell division protein FtsB [Methylophilaceae bacterium]